MEVLKTVIEDEKKVDTAVQSADKAIDTAATKVVNKADKVAKKVDSSVNELILFEIKVEKAFSKNIVEAEGIIAKVKAWYKNILIKSALKELDKIQTAEGIVVKDAKTEINSIKDLVTKYEAKILNYDKLLVSDTLVMKRAWSNALANLRKAVGK